MNCTAVGIDIAKNVFRVRWTKYNGCDEAPVVVSERLCSQIPSGVTPTLPCKPGGVHISVATTSFSLHQRAAKFYPSPDTSAGKLSRNAPVIPRG
jgi:hypothetical protein